MPAPPLPFAQILKRRIAAEVVAIFNDKASGDRPVMRTMVKTSGAVTEGGRP